MYFTVKLLLKLPLNLERIRNLLALSLLAGRKFNSSILTLPELLEFSCLIYMRNIYIYIDR